MTETVYITVYNGRWHEDGFEIGDVYDSEAEAEEAAENREDAEHSWWNGCVTEREIHR